MSPEEQNRLLPTYRMSEEKNHLPVFKSPLVQSSSRSSSTTSVDEAPTFRRYNESTHAELFYDLFFVANLTVFTAVHEVNDSTSLRQYIGFFAVLWLTWYQVSLYDVRFSVDSVFDRIAKALQFGVMIGFAIIGPQFNVGVKNKDQSEAAQPNWKSFRALSLILMASRLVLVWQYLQTTYFARNIKNTRLPLLSVAGTYLIAAFVYLGLFFTFSEKGSNQAYIAWYVVALTEALIATSISSFWRVISFKGTHLVQRMGLLTLIFLGEGIIGAAKRAQKIFTSDVIGYSPQSVGNLVCIILIIYFLYMLYFDWVEEKHFGTIRQQIWAFLHFPLHIAIVVAVEGGAQVLTWTAANAASDRLTDYFSSIVDAAANTTQETVNALAETATTIVEETFGSTSIDGYTKWIEQQSLIMSGLSILNSTDASADNKTLAGAEILLTLNNMIYNVAGFKEPEHHKPHTFADVPDEAAASILSASLSIYEVFSLTFGYFFVAIGLVVILIGIIAMISKTDKNALHWIRLGVNLFIGIGLCSIAAIVATMNQLTGGWTAFDSYAASPWMLPTVLLALFAAVLLNNVDLLRRRTRTKQIDE